MQQVNSLISDKLICVLVEVFFILGFTFLFYKYNIYVAWGIIPFFILINKSVYKYAIFFAFLLTLLSLFYYYCSGFSSAFRVVKTMVVILPFFLTNILQREQYCLSKIFRLFMKLNAILVCIDFFLYFIIGHTIMTFTQSGFMPRPCGFLEDSNFFSYLMLVYVFYYKWHYGQYSKLFIASLLLSGSFSAIFSFLMLFFVFKKKCTEGVCSLKFKILIVVIALSIVGIYDLFAIHSGIVLEFISELQMNDLLKVKMASMTHRFTTVSNAMSEMDTMNEYLWGIGAGKTRGLSEIGLNLHNSFLQMFLEMGGVLVVVILFMVFLMIRNIKTTRYVILLCVVFSLSAMMETFYNPLLAFVYFISFSNIHKWELKHTI